MTDDERALWQRYRDATDSAAPRETWSALLKEIDAFARKARKSGAIDAAFQIGVLRGYVNRGLEAHETPEDRLAKIWPGLLIDRIRNALDLADRALKNMKLSELRKAKKTLQQFQGSEALAEIAEEGLAAELAPLIPGAIDDHGMLALSREHDELIQRAQFKWMSVSNAIARVERGEAS